MLQLDFCIVLGASLWHITKNEMCVIYSSLTSVSQLLSISYFTPGIQEFPENIKNCKVLAIVEASVNPISK